MLRTLRLLAYVCLPLVTLLPASLWANTAYGGGRTILYVDVDATGGDGSSWTNAYKTLQAALDRTNANGVADFEIWVAEGVYYPDEGGSHVANSPEEFFRINYDNVQFYGGFAATETLRTQRIPSVHLTILSGDIDHESNTGKDINNDGNFIAETSADIQGINAYHVLYLDGQTNEPLTYATVLDGFIVTGGSAYGSGWEAHGGGLYCAAMSESKGCSPTIANITFSGNMASRYGGGMYNWGYDGTSSPALTNVTFTGNQAVNGGGMYNSGEGGGVSSPSLTNVTFSGNQAGDGGGMSNYGYGGTSSPVLTNVTFSGNMANAGGGGMFNWGYYGTSSPVLTNVTFSGNRADLGGGVYNWADERGGTSSPALTNVIMWGDSAPIGAEIYNTGATPAIAYSDIDQDGFTGTGNNIRLNPQFVAPVDASSAPTSTGNYRLRLGSPAIDAGTNTGCPATDLDGTTRPWDGNGDGSAICDIGAYETHPLFVDKDATSGANNGSSWASAYTTLQDALDWTNAHGSAPFEIWVAEGVYYPDLRTGQNTNLQSDSFRVSYDNVQIYGGFAATETLRTQRMPSVHFTILSGDIDGNDINTYGNKVAETSADIVGSNAYHVLYFDGVTNEAISAATVLDGFIVTGGSASGGDSDANGGGLYCVGSDVGKSCSPTVAHITFSGNIADSSGGGMYNDGANGISSPVLTNVTFTGNRAGSGGGMYNYAYVSGISSPSLTNVTFTGNRAGDGGGGGMFNWGTYGVSSPVLTNVIFTGNQSSYGAGGMFNWGYNGISSPVLTNVTFSGNQAGDGGGGMYNWSDSHGSSNPSLTNVTFSGNQAVLAGGGVYNYAGNSGTSSLQLVNVIMWGDSATEGSELYNYGNAMPAITYSDIDQDGIAGTGNNIRLNPQFVAPVDASSAPTNTGNYRILPGSPAIDAGTNTGCPATDLDGLTRPWDGNGDGNAICDMGAYEAQLLFVNANATGGTYDGSSWANAYTTLQDALDRTNAHGASIFEIWVAEGTYYPDLRTGQNTNVRSASFRISYDNVQIYGGFAATETLRPQRMPEVHLTILSGDIDGNDTNNDGNFVAETSANIQGSNAYHVLYLDGETNEPLTTATVIDGFIVTAGAAGGSNADSYGGGLYCAAIGVGTGCSPTIAHVTFSGNQAGFAGGGMCNTGFYGGVSSPVLNNVTFSGNQAASTGGGMYNHSDSGGVSSPVLANVTFSGNKAYTGGGMTDYSYAGTSSPVLINVTFSGNQANSGGGMLNFVQSNGTSSPQLVNVVMWGDSATTFAEIVNNGATPVISYSDIDQDGIEGTGSIRQDPEFVAPVDASSAPTSKGNYRMQPGSPAIDTGTNTGCPTTDLDGLTRPWDGNGDGSAICDMGAYEAQLLFVDKDATGGTHDGSSWANAYMTLQDALDRTNTHGATAFEIWVAEGIYYPDLGGTHVANSPKESFRISYDNVQIYGSFAATETLRTQRNPAANATILSGDIDADNGGVDTNTDGNFIAETSADIQGSNAYHVLYLDGAANEPITAATVLDGFIVTAGRATGSDWDSDGGGLYCATYGVGTGCSPTVTHVTFSGNLANDGGGGMVSTGYGSVNSPALTNVTFSGNEADKGGGMFNDAAGGASSPTFTNVTFSGNVANSAGGGMFNNATFGSTSSPVLTNVSFSGNTANTSGGGMANGVEGNGTSSPQLVNVIMWGDDATTFAEIGGGTPAISYSDIDQDGIVGTGNFRRDPLLSSLGDYGGGMLTFALLPGSPAIDRGNAAACAAAPVNNLDQRGVSRPQGGGCDIGAFESRGFILMAAGGSPQETTIFSPFSLPLAVLAGSADAEPLGPGAVITLTPPAEGPGLTVTAPFTVTTDAEGLTAGTVVTSNGVVGSFNVTATTAGAAFPTVFSLANTPPLPPIARADVAAVLQDTPLLIDVLANDLPGTSPQLAVDTVTQPLAGGVAAIEQNRVRFTPTAGFTGLVTFTSTIHDGNALADTAPVTVRITALNSTDGEPQVLSLPAPTSKGGGTVTVPAGTTEIEVPAGAITPAEDPLATYDLVYQELKTPEPPPPGTLFTFGGRAFVLQLFINAELQTPYTFNVPIYVTISYDPNVVTDTSKLALYYYDEGSQQWANDGITILSVDTQAHTFRASIAHLTEFAAGITVPTGLDPNLEPQILPQLFLPQVQS